MLEVGLGTYRIGVSISVPIEEPRDSLLTSPNSNDTDSGWAETDDCNPWNRISNQFVKHHGRAVCAVLVVLSLAGDCSRPVRDRARKESVVARAWIQG